MVGQSPFPLSDHDCICCLNTTSCHWPPISKAWTINAVPCANYHTPLWPLSITKLSIMNHQYHGLTTGHWPSINHHTPLPSNRYLVNQWFQGWLQFLFSLPISLEFHPEPLRIGPPQNQPLCSPWFVSSKLAVIWPSLTFYSRVFTIINVGLPIANHCYLLHIFHVIHRVAPHSSPFFADTHDLPHFFRIVHHCKLYSFSPLFTTIISIIQHF